MTLALLRQETGPLHKALEEKLQLFQTVKSKEQYAGHLLRLHQWLSPLEQRLGPFASELLMDWPQREKRAWIEEDLAALDLELPPPALAPLPPCSSFSQCLGILYVLEGSSLGAQIISRHYAETLGLRPETGLRYFTGYGHGTGAMWRNFLAVLEENFSSHPDKTSELIDSACAAFQSYSRFIPRDHE
jgi:heme oxygenase